MKKIINTSTKELTGSHIYLKRSNKEYDMLYIGVITDVIKDENLLKYKLKHCYMLTVPKEKNRKAYTYENVNEIDIYKDEDLYMLDYDEYIETFRNFVKCEGTYSQDLPEKIIADK